MLLLETSNVNMFLYHLYVNKNNTTLKIRFTLKWLLLTSRQKYNWRYTGHATVTKLNHSITKTCLYNFDPLKPHFYIVKLGFTGVYIIFLISAQNIDCGFSLEPPRRGGSNEYPQYMFLSRNMKNIIFLSENFQFLVVKCSIFLNRCVFVMPRQLIMIMQTPHMKPQTHELWRNSTYFIMFIFVVGLVVTSKHHTRFRWRRKNTNSM